LIDVWWRRFRVTCWLVFLLAAGSPVAARQNGSAWSNFGGDAQHTSVSARPSQSLTNILWQTPVDLQPQYSGSNLLIHYGSPLVTAANTVLLPLKTGAAGGFSVEARQSVTGTLLWSLSSDYVLPPSRGWTPPFGPALTSGPRVYLPGIGGTVLYRDQPDSAAGAEGRIAFYGLANYRSDPQAYNASVVINTPITSDSAGNIYFGFVVSGSTPLQLQSGIARISASGEGRWIPASIAAGDAGITQVAYGSAPALNAGGDTLYVAVSNGSAGYLVALNSVTLAPVAAVRLKDPKSGMDAFLNDSGSASPTVGLDGDVFFGVLERPLGTNHYRGWLLHFDSLLGQAKTPGSFGWDTTASLVPSSAVPSYSGASSYLLMTKYNDYSNPGVGGSGLNKLAILDPNATQTDPTTGAAVMNEVLTIVGPTPNPPLAGVREWCINSAAVDPATKSVLANNEDGKLYRWDLTTNTLSEQIVLTAGLGQAYTPTVIGSDGVVYAINNATLFAVGSGPPSPAEGREFSIPPGGASSINSLGASTTTAVGYARINPGNGAVAPGGVAIYSYRPGGYLVSETGVPAVAPVTSGRTYVEVDGIVNTGLAIANPNSQAALISFFYTDSSGTDVGAGSTIIPAGGHLADFIDEPVFKMFSGLSFRGTLTFTSNVPVAVTALRALRNERADFLMSTLPVIDLSATVGTGISVVPHFADGAGWTSQLLLINPTNSPLAGVLEFRDDNGALVEITIGGQARSSLPYSVAGRSFQKVETNGASPFTISGSVRIIPSGDNPFAALTPPIAEVIFAYRAAGVTVTEAGVPAIAGRNLRSYVEHVDVTDAVGDVQSALAITNNSSAAANVTLQLVHLDGTLAGIAASYEVAALGRQAKMLAELFPNQTLPNPFRGVLRITTTSSSISAVSLRIRVNENADYVLTATPASDEATPVTGEVFFPHLADGGGFTTQFVLFSPTAGQTINGTLRFVDSSGESLDLPVR
jgi:hypothetical protein